MKGIIVAAMIGLVLTGCGSQDRSALARKTVQSYWKDVGHGKFDQSYRLLSSGVQASVPQKEYAQNMYGFLTHTSGVSAKVGTPRMTGDCALVPVALESPQAPGGKFRAWQHLYWTDGKWRITEENGGLTEHPEKKLTCPTG